MAESTDLGNVLIEGRTPTVAALTNVALLAGVVERVRKRPRGLPGMAVFYGPSGYGKSFAASYTVAKYRAHLVQVKSTWTRRDLCQAILFAMVGDEVRPAKTLSGMVGQIGKMLTDNPERPLVIDEADYLIRGAGVMIDLVRDIYESSGGSIVLIGEEQLPNKLQAWERVHNRMLDWGAAQPATPEDVALLARHYAPGITIEPALLAELRTGSKSVARRVCINLTRVAEKAKVQGRTTMTVADWGGAPWYTGDTPRR